MCCVGEPDLVALVVEGRHPLPRDRAARLPEEGGRAGADVGLGRCARSLTQLVWFWYASVRVGSAAACTRYHMVSRCSIMERACAHACGVEYIGCPCEIIDATHCSLDEGWRVRFTAMAT